MLLDFMFGFFIAIPVLIGVLGYPWAIWKRLDSRFLDKRGVRFWKKVAVVFGALIPAFVTLFIFGVLTQWLDVGSSSAAWERARAVAPRAIPPEAYPMGIGMLAGILCLAPFFAKLTRKLPYFNVAEEQPVEVKRCRRTQAELHRLEWHVKSMFLPLRKGHIDAVPLSEISAFTGASAHIKKRFYEDFSNADFLVITKRTIDSRKVKRKDIKYSLKTAIVAEDDDCLTYIPSLARDPVANIKGIELLALLKDGAALLVSQPEIKILISSQELEAIKTVSGPSTDLTSESSN